MLYNSMIMFMTLFLRIDIVVFIARLFEPLSQCRDYFPEPIKVQDAQRRIADNIRHGEPRRYRQASRRLEGRPDVLIHPHALIGAPNQSTSPECRDERDAIDELCRRASHAELIHKPMNIEKRRRQLVENEVQAVIIAKWPLGACQPSPSHPRSQYPTNWALTNPNNDTANALTACINAPGPCTSKFPALVTRSHRKYPAANPCTIPLAPVYPQTRSRGPIAQRSSSKYITASAAAFTQHDWRSETARAFQLTLVRGWRPG